MTNDQLTPGSIWRHKTNRQFYILEDVRPFRVEHLWDEHGLVNYHGRESARPYARTTTDWLANFDKVEDPK